MELEEWLRLYQALNVTASGKERSYWTISGIFLLANCLLAFPFSFIFFSYTGGQGRYFITVLAGIGVLLSFSWWFSQKRAAYEIAHFVRLLRSIEGQFAGAEFHRSLYRLLAGEEVCIPSTAWKCKEWYPDVARLNRLTRTLPHGLLPVLPFVFVLTWTGLAVAVWLA